MTRFTAAGAFALALSTPLTALATQQRSFVSVDGSDAHVCTVQLPCRSFAVAIAHTNPGGEVIALDSGGYGPVTITKPVTIVSPPGIYAGMSVFNGAGVTIAAGNGDSVTLRGLAINAQGAGAKAVSFTSGGRLVIDGCTISGAFTHGISVNGPMTPLIAIENTHITEAGVGVDIGGPGAVLARVALSGSMLSHVGTGLQLHAGGDVAIEHSSLIGAQAGGATGIDVNASGVSNPIHVHVANSVIAQFGVGVSAVGSATSGRVSIAESDLANNQLGVSVNGGVVALSGNRIVHTAQMLHAVGGGVVNTSGSNYSAFNPSAGDPPSAPSGSL